MLWIIAADDDRTSNLGQGRKADVDSKGVPDTITTGPYRERLWHGRIPSNLHYDAVTYISLGCVLDALMSAVAGDLMGVSPDSPDGGIVKNEVRLAAKHCQHSPHRCPSSSRP